MIAFDRVSKVYRTSGKPRAVLDQCSFLLPPGRNVGVLGANGAGKSTLLRLISGAEYPDTGRVHRRSRVSFPLGFAGNFHPQLTGRQNASFVARIYGENIRRVLDFVYDFSELGVYLDMPIRTYSSGMMAKLAFAVSLAIDFELYLIDEVTEVGDARFRQKCAAIFRERISKSDIVMVSHNSHTIRTYCNAAAILAEGRLTFFASVEDAMRAYQKMMGTFDA